MRTLPLHLFRMMCALLVLTAILPSAAHAINCTSLTSTPIAFGNVNVANGAAVPSTATLTLTCSEAPINKPFRVCVPINGGTASSDATSRLMSSTGGGTLRYQLSTNAGMTTPWGTWAGNLYGGGFTWDITSSTASVSRTLTIYGKVLGSQQTVSPGSYISTLSFAGWKYSSNTNAACPGGGNTGTTSTFAATATVTAGCTVSANAMAFGNVTSLSSPVDTTANININCSNGTTYNVLLGLGNGSGVTNPAQRKITNSGGQSLTYGLYQDSARSTVWGNTVGTSPATLTGSGNTQPITVYGRLNSQTIPGAGSYTDSVVVTVVY